MASFSDFTRQSDFLASLPVDSALSPAGYYLLGVCHARTGLSTPSLLPFLQEIEISHRTGWLTIEERRMVEFEVYIGALGTARALLSACTEGKVSDCEEGMTRLCDICGEQSLIGSGWVIDERCGHFSHRKCGKTVIRPLMLEGGEEPIICPVANCRVSLPAAQLEALFGPEDYEILHEYWMHPKEPNVVVLCPNFHCKASSLWSISQYFSCRECAHTYCLHCLTLLNPPDRTHICGPHSEEALSIAAEFTQGGRFKACESCGYWCSLREGRVMCCCGEEICGKCVLKREQCRCGQSFVERMLSLPQEWLQRI